MNPLAEDLDHIVALTRDLWEALRGQRLFITGGTGFFGCWLLESFAWANDQLGLRAEAVVLTRSPDSFRAKAPHLARHPAICLHTGDVRSFVFPPGVFSYVIHGATETSPGRQGDGSLLIFDTIVLGTRRSLEFARQCGAHTFLLTSSGAVYGPQPAGLTHVPEEHGAAPDPADARSAYAEGKRAAETLCARFSEEYGSDVKIARCFAFVGPYLQLDGPFAVGNFIRDGLAGGPIQISGDGTAYRSYLYAADLAIWLWTILFRGESGRPYNVGSSAALTIGELAQRVALAFTPPVAVQIAQSHRPSQPGQRYIPDTRRAQTELGLTQTVDLTSAIRRTVAWNAR